VGAMGIRISLMLKSNMSYNGSMTENILSPNHLDNLLSRFILSGASLEKLNIISLYSQTVPSKWNIHRRIQNHYLLALITGGEGELLVGEGVHALKTHSSYLIGPRVKHSIETNRENPLQILTIHFSINEIENSPLFVYCDLNLSYFLQLRQLLSSAFISSYFNEDRYQQFKLKNNLFQILLLLREFLFEQPREINDFTSILNSLDPGENYTIKELSEIFRYSEKSFIRKFRKLYGITPHQFLIKKKISHGRYLLSNTELSIKEVAATLNYKDQYIFSAQFKKNMGESPTCYRSRTSEVFLKKIH
jgi:AraC-like DNA-binding protein